MYLLYFETADAVDIYYDSDDSNYDDEKLSDNIYNGTWYVNPLSANPPTMVKSTLKQFAAAADELFECV